MEPAKIIVLSLEELEALIKRLLAEALKAGSHGSTDLANKDWLKAEEAALLYGLPKTWFEEKGRAGEIARTKPGRYTLFEKRDIENYLKEHKKTS